MNHAAQFGYAQARLQARHGARADEQLWRHLASIGDFTSYLQAARRSTLRPWVLGIQVNESSHSIELHLRQQFRGYVDEVAEWLPVRWGDSVRWVKRLPDLPALQHLMNGESAPAWMLEDPGLRVFASETIALRLEAMRNSDVKPLLSAWQRGNALPDAWLEQWQGLWPTQAANDAGMTRLAHMMRRQLQIVRSAPTVPTDHQRSHIEHRLALAFRRYSLTPAAACAHLGLIALDLEKLRGELAYRRLFTETAQLLQ